MTASLWDEEWGLLGYLSQEDWIEHIHDCVAEELAD